MDLLVFSHLRWDFVYQRPQHLLSRFATAQRVFFWEEPEFRDNAIPSLKISPREDFLTVVVPELPTGGSEQQTWALQQELLAGFREDQAIEDYICWYYTPMARNFTRNLKPAAVVYDCMDELSAFRGAPPGLTRAEEELFSLADLVFTGGQSLYESKRSRHPSVHLFPSSIDAKHFAKARQAQDDPVDQSSIPHPRLGYCGVIDERMDLELLAAMADSRPDWQFIMVGPVVKITDADLPERANIHYLGSKQYSDLPNYLSGWEVALLPFARNESTRFISPTKTPEYLAAGRPVISTAITDVVRPYGDLGLVSICNTAAQFIDAVEQSLFRDLSKEEERLRQVDAFLARSSWDRTFSDMRRLIMKVATDKDAARSVGAAEQLTGNTAAAD